MRASSGPRSCWPVLSDDEIVIMPVGGIGIIRSMVIMPVDVVMTDLHMRAVGEGMG
jgi:hypothetical protein